MTYSYLQHISEQLAAAVWRVLSIRRFGATVTLALVLGLAANMLPGVGLAHAQSPGVAAPPATVNINSADAVTLAAGLKGIGSSRAAEIVRYREAYGPFTSVDELGEVKGIGKSTLDDNRALITLE